MINMIICIIALSSFSATRPTSSPEIINDYEDSLILIANEEGTPDEISSKDLLKVLKGQKPKWGGGTKVRLALMKPKTKTGELTATKVYGMSPNELSKYWLAMVFQGKSSPPKFFNYESDLIKYVNKTEGAIGIISRPQEELPKIILVDGKELLY